MFCLQAVLILPIKVEFLQLLTLIPSLINFVLKRRPVFYEVNNLLVVFLSFTKFQTCSFLLDAGPPIDRRWDERSKGAPACFMWGMSIRNFPAFNPLHCWTVPFSCHSLLGGPHRDRFSTIQNHISLIWFGIWTVFRINSISGTLIAIVFTSKTRIVIFKSN
jgi:hypothetical protein